MGSPLGMGGMGGSAFPTDNPASEYLADVLQDA